MRPLFKLFLALVLLTSVLFVGVNSASGAICGEACTQNSDCDPSTTYSVDVRCINNVCTNYDCSQRGGTTEFGSLCRCFGVSHTCGEDCGASIGLCDPGFSCTYKARSQCSPLTRYPVCVPTGSGAGGGGNILSVPQYGGAYFQRSLCGSGTADPGNRYLYHPTFPNPPGTPNHLFTNNEVSTYLCDPQIGSAGGWFQVRDGDVVAKADLISFVPTTTCTQPSCNPAFNLRGLGGYPGLPIYSGANYDFSDDTGSGGTPAEGTPWIARSDYRGREFSYDFFTRQLPPDVPLNTVDDKNNLSTGTFRAPNAQESPDGYVWFKIVGDATINGNVQLLQGDKVILLVEGGDLRIENNITLANPGEDFFMAIVGQDAAGNRGNIIITTASNELQGLFFADGEISTGTGGSSNDDQLHISGGFVGMEGVVLQRDLGSDNSDTPAEFVEFLPQLTLTFPREFYRDRVVWREVAP